MYEREVIDTTGKQYFLDGSPWPYFLVDSKNEALIIVSRDQRSQNYADTMGIKKGKDGLTEVFESSIEYIAKDFYIYNGRKRAIDTSLYDFTISFKQKRYTSELATTSIFMGAYNLKVIKMNDPSRIPEYLKMLHKGLESFSGKEKANELEIVKKIEKLLEKYVC